MYINTITYDLLIVGSIPREMTVVYPTNFRKVVLRCIADNNASFVNYVFIKETCDSHMVQLSFRPKAYLNGGTIMDCIIADSKDGGAKYLIIVDILRHGNKDLTSQSWRERRDLIETLWQDSSFINRSDLDTEYRVRLTRVFKLNDHSRNNDYIDTKSLFSVVLPNYYCQLSGIAFVQETPWTDTQVQNKVRDGDKESLVIVKTRFSDVYEVTRDGINKVGGNHIAYIPNIDHSLKLRNMFARCNSMRMQCQFSDNIQKWIPIV